MALERRGKVPLGLPVRDYRIPPLMSGVSIRLYIESFLVGSVSPALALSVSENPVTVGLLLPKLYRFEDFKDGVQYGRQRLNFGSRRLNQPVFGFVG